LVDLSIITSLYRSAVHLPVYTRILLKTVAEVAQAGYNVQLTLIANDPTPEEVQLMADLTARAESVFSIQIQSVSRETLYASWNRGMNAAEGHVLGIWNVDDRRNAAAFIEGIEKIKAGCDLVEFPFQQVTLTRWLGEQVQLRPPQYRADVLHRKTRLSPFFLFSKDLYHAAGSFDAHFRISGDFEWGERPAVRSSRICYGEAIAGQFVVHGGNLSGGGGNQRQTIEDNIVFMRHQHWDLSQIRPVADGEAMRQAWESWGNPGGVHVPEDVASKLWGAEARTYYQRWLSAYQRQQRGDTLRRIPRALINKSGLRPLLARFGIVKGKA